MEVPDGGMLLALLIAPTLAGFFCGLTGAGSAILIQVCFRLFSSFLGISIAEDLESSSRRIIAIASVLSLTQYPVSAFQLYRSPQRHIRWDIVAFIFPGLNILVWLGTWIAMYFKPQLLAFILGVVLILIAGWQFFHQSIMGRKVDDDRTRQKVRSNLNRKMSTYNLTIDAVSVGPNSSSYHESTQTGGVVGTDLADLGTLGEVEPKMPKKLKAPNPSFDLKAYGNITGLDFTTIPVEESPSNSKNKGRQFSDSEAIQIGDSAGDLDDIDLAMAISHDIPDTDTRPWHVRILEKAQTFEGILGLICGAVAGILGGSYGINGPPILLYLAYLKLNSHAIRDTCVVIFLSNIPCLILARIVFNVYKFDEIFIYAIAVSTSLCGLYLGFLVHPFCDTRIVTSLLQLIILLASVPLTEPGTGEPVNIVFLVIYLVIAAGLCAFMVWRVSRNNQIKEQVKQQFYTLHGNPTEPPTK